MLKLSVTSVMTNPEVCFHMIYMNMIQHLSGPNTESFQLISAPREKKCKGRSLFFKMFNLI